MDFAENFSCSYGEEIQAAYFNKNYVALHPREVHYRNKYQDEDDETDLGCKLYISIADDRSHNASTVFAVLQHFIPKLKQDLLNIRYIHYLTDSKKSEYRNIFITTTLLKHESIFRSELTGYSSKPGTARVHLTVWAGSQKRHVEEAIKRKQLTVIDYAEYCFKWAQGDTTSKNNYVFVYGKAVLGGKGQMDGTGTGCQTS